MRVLSSMATKELLTELLADPAVVGTADVTLAPGGGVTMAGRLRDGERADVAVLASDALERLGDEGVVDAGTIRGLFVSEVVLAVPAGGELPALASADDLREILLGAEQVGYSTGPSGDGLLRMLDDWGVRDHLEERLVQAPAGTPVARLLANGDITVGVQQRSEFTGVDGVEVVGPLPPGCELTTVFAGAVASASADAEGARRILDGLASRAAADTTRRHGMEPVTT